MKSTITTNQRNTAEVRLMQNILSAITTYDHAKRQEAIKRGREWQKRRATR
jgi:hypothetical protein